MTGIGETRFTLAAILALQLLTGLGAIVLLERMSPAILQIMSENVQSAEAAETMLATLASRPSDRAVKTFEHAMETAASNVTEHEEHAPLREIKANYRAALRGDEAASERVTVAAQKVGQINREAMRRADRNARDLGVSGAWAVAVLSLLTFGLGWFAYLRLRNRLLLPLAELRDVVDANARGELQRRCAATPSAPEVRDMREAINALLDRELAKNGSPRTA